MASRERGCGFRINARSFVEGSAMPVLGIAPTLAGARGQTPVTAGETGARRSSGALFTVEVIEPPVLCAAGCRPGGARPMTKDDIRMLCAYNRWANARILDAAAKLTDEQFVSPGTFPHGGLRGTLVHTLFAEWTWRMRWLGTPPQYGYRFKAEEFPTVA